MMKCKECGGDTERNSTKDVYDYNDYVLLFKTERCTSCGYRVRFK